MTDLLKYNFSVSGTALFLSFDEIYKALLKSDSKKIKGSIKMAN